MRFQRQIAQGLRFLLLQILYLGSQGITQSEGFKRNWAGYKRRKNADFRTINRHISETMNDRRIVTTEN